MRRTGKEKGIVHLGLIITAVVVLAAIALGGWYVWQKNKDNKKANNTNTSQDNETKEEKQEPKVTAPEGWLFYKNEEAGFSFYYPPEWGEVRKSETAYRFSELSAATFDTHERSLEAASMEFGIIEPIVTDVYLENGEPNIKLAPGFQKIRDFSSDQLVQKLSSNKACVAEDYYWRNYISDPESVNGYIYFGYCGLVNEKFGAFTFSSGSLDVTEPKTEDIKEDITKLLKTFEIF